MKNFHETLSSQNRTEQNRTEQNRTEQNRTEQNRTDSKLGIPIFQKQYEFYKLLYQYIKLFPKKDRYSLGGRIEETTLVVFERIIQASQSLGDTKVNYLQTASVKLDVLKILIRLAKDVQALDNKKYLELQELLQGVGKMLGGWLKATKQNT